MNPSRLSFACIVLAACGEASDPKTTPDVVDTRAPTIVSESPVDGATDVALDAIVSITFSEPIVTTNSAFILRDSNRLAVEMVVTPNADNTVVELDPAEDLLPGTIYTVTVAETVEDLAGNRLASDHSWTFTTVIPPLETALDGEWIISRIECDGTESDGILDGAGLSMTFAGSSAVLEFGFDTCNELYPFDVVYDDATDTVSAVPNGQVSCTPSNCSERCGASASSLMAGLSGSVEVEGSTLVLSGSDNALMPSSLCLRAGLAAPGRHIFRRNRRVTFYVATDEPGASNTLCDGLAAVDEGNGHCPYKDFTAPQTMKWSRARNITMVVKPGTYYVQQQFAIDDGNCEAIGNHWDFAGIWITAQRGISFEERVILRGDNAEGEVILAGLGCDGVCCATDDEYDKRPLHLLDVYGHQVEVSGFTFKDAAYHDVVWGASHSRFYDNVLFGPLHWDADSLKGAGAYDVEVSGNVFDGFNNQAIDIAGTNHDWIIENNIFKNGHDGALGGKCGTHDVIFRYNTVFGLTNTIWDGKRYAVGTGSCHISKPWQIEEFCDVLSAEPCYSVERLLIYGNTFSDLSGWLTNGKAFGAAGLYSCFDCQFYDNDISDADFGFASVEPDYGDPTDPTDPREHPAIEPSVSLSFFDNDFSDIRTAYYLFEPNSYSSLGTTTGNRMCIAPTAHPDCGTSDDPGDARDTAYHPDASTSCSDGQGGMTLNEVEAEVGDLGVPYWTTDCPF
ncbi:Ig-like domain-containing protein [Myxococcota bacterium]